MKGYEYMPTDKQYDGSLIDEFYKLIRIRKVAVSENSVNTIELIDDELAVLISKIDPLQLPKIKGVPEELLNNIKDR